MSAQTAESIDTTIMDSTNVAWILSLGGTAIVGIVQSDAYGISTNALQYYKYYGSYWHYTKSTFMTPATPRQSTINTYGVSCGKQLHNLNNGNNIDMYSI